MSEWAKETPISVKDAVDAPARLNVGPGWKCSGYSVNPLPDQNQAFNQLDCISQLMYGHPSPNPPTGEMSLQLQELMKGETAMNAIASLCTRPEFVKLIWGIATGAAFDHCVQLLGVQNVQEIQDLRQGYIDLYFNQYLACSSDVQGKLDFGWMIASVLSTQQWASLNLDCNDIPPLQLNRAK